MKSSCDVDTTVEWARSVKRWKSHLPDACRVRVIVNNPTCNYVYTNLASLQIKCQIASKSGSLIKILLPMLMEITKYMSLSLFISMGIFRILLHAKYFAFGSVHYHACRAGRLSSTRSRCPTQLNSKPAPDLAQLKASA